MAKFVLGGIVTNIAGSVGGTTLRRVPNGFSMYNKIKGTSNSKLLQNPRVPQIGNIFQRWSLLTDSERNGWDANALTVTFPDKFGVAKNLTGRQLFSKANIQLLPVNSSVDDSTGFTTTTIPFGIIEATYNTGSQELLIDFSGVGDEVRFLISVEISNKKIYQPTFKSRKVIFEGTTDLPGDFDISGAVLENYPFWNSNYYTVVYVQQINSFGMVSPYQYAFVEVFTP